MRKFVLRMTYPEGIVGLAVIDSETGCIVVTTANSKAELDEPIRGFVWAEIYNDNNDLFDHDFSLHLKDDILPRYTPIEEPTP